MLAGRTVAITADRRATEQAELFRKRGATVLHGPTMRTINLTEDATLRAVTAELIADPPRWTVATTGMGMRYWLEAADGWGQRAALLDALASGRVVARGVKSSSAVRQAGLDVAWRAPGENMAEIVDHLRGEGIGGARIALQLFDPDDHPSSADLRNLGADLVEVPVYRWLLPEDPGPADRLVDAITARAVDAVTFTSQPAVRFLCRLAARRDLDAPMRRAFNDGALNGGVLPACIGPVCAEAARECGIDDPVWPEPFRLVPMVKLVADRLTPPDGSWLPRP
ncbi:hypothetical protein BH24ACT3_BH24ACT3_02920 [soil metagenome]